MLKVFNKMKNWSKYVKVGLVVLILGFCGLFIFLHSQDMVGFSFGRPSNRGTSDTIGAPNLPQGESTSQAATPTGQPPSSQDGGTNDFAIITDAERIDILNAVNIAAHDYMWRSMNAPFISRFGYLYNPVTEEFVTVDSLVAKGFLSDEYLQYDIMILFLRMTDMVHLRDAATGHGGLVIFTGMDTITGIGLVCPSTPYFDYFYEIYREDLNTILLNMISCDGEIVRPAFADSVYQAVFSDISGILNPAEIRYMAYNSSHVFAVASVIGASHQMRYFLYEINSADSVTRLDFSLEGDRHPIAAINLAAPNFNFELWPDFPNFVIGGVEPPRLSLLSPEHSIFSQLTEFLVQQGYEQYADAMPEFMAATASYAYMVYGPYDAVLVTQGSGSPAAATGWRFHFVSGWQEAEAILQGLEGAPLYILNQR
jgi:hypothetical protein